MMMDSNDGGGVSSSYLEGRRAGIHYCMTLHKSFTIANIMTNNGSMLFDFPPPNPYHEGTFGYPEWLKGWNESLEIEYQYLLPKLGSNNYFKFEVPK
jgi:hypothetical protein